MKQIIRDFLKGLKQLGQETVEKGVEEAEKVAETVITGKELLGDISPMTPDEYSQKKQAAANQDQEEINKIRNQIKEPGRNVEQEIEEVRKEKEQLEDEKEKQFLEKVRMQREQERQEMSMGTEEPAGRQARGKMNGGGKKKKGAPDMQMMTQTGEVKGKVD